MEKEYVEKVVEATAPRIDFMPGYSTMVMFEFRGNLSSALMVMGMTGTPGQSVPSSCSWNMSDVVS